MRSGVCRLAGFMPLLACAVVLAACGFQLRGDVTIPFRDLFITAPTGSPVAADLTRKLVAAHVKIAPAITGADARVTIVAENRDKIILSLSGAGRVREFQLKLRVGYQVTDARGTLLVPASEVNLTRIMSYDDAFVLAKQQEETLLYRDMEHDVVDQILRRLANVKRSAQQG
jgi:LPS-assembly lipoprotein